MNTAQLIRQALYNIDAIRQDSTTDPFFTQTELLAWANDGKERVEKVARLSQEDYGLLIMQSDDSTYRWGNISYAPSSLQLVAGTHRYTLPPDLVELKRIRCITTNYEDIQFIPSDLSSVEFRDTENDTDFDSDVIPFDIVGERTLYIACDPPATVDVEIAYIARSTGLQLYTTGTVALVNGSATVTGGGTSWVTNGVYNTVEMIVSADATAPKIVGQTSTGTWVDPASIYYPVQSITADGTATLAGTWLQTGVSGYGYMFATVPAVPSEHHPLIVDYICYRALKKAGSSRQAHFKEAFEDGIKEMKSDIAVRQTHDPVTVEDVNFWR